LKHQAIHIPKGAKALLCLLALLLSIGAAFGQTVREEEQFHYITQLYLSSDRYLSEVKAEAEAFQSTWPNSVYAVYMDYYRANVALKQGDYQLCLELYPRLLRQNLHPDIIGDVHLNYAIALYYTGDYSGAAERLEELGKAVDKPFYAYQAHVWRGRVYAIQGHYLSAEQEFSLARQTDPTEVRYDYFLTLLKLERGEKALAVMNEAGSGTPPLAVYHQAWLEYLLSQGDYQDFDRFIAELRQSGDGLNPNLNLLRVRKALELEDFPAAAALMDSVGTAGDTVTYYRALLLKEQGQAAAADSLFRNLLSSAEPDLGFFAYLERLKLLYERDPLSATLQLQNYIKTSELQRGEHHHQLGYFLMRQERHSDAIHQFLRAEDFDLPAVISDRNTDLLGQSYFLVGDYALAAQTYNAYLNRFFQGKYRDKAIYHIGLASFQQALYPQARLHFEKLIAEYPLSPWLDEAKFYLAEVHFLASEYPQAETLLENIKLTEANYSSVLLRLAQTFYYQNKFAEALHTISGIQDSLMSFDATVLVAGVRFNQKDYETALTTYRRAETLARTEPQKTEAISYQAYTLYYLKRYQDASQLFYQLSRDSVNADIYLYQAGKSAAQGKEWRRAIDLYEDFLDTFPQSPYFLSVLAEIANIQYNLGNYAEALEDWLNLISRFTANTSVSPAEQPLLNEVFTGIEICARRLDDPDYIDRIVSIIDNFRSDYIKFELEYIVVKLYADAELWDDLLKEAASLRQSLGAEDARRDEVGLLMAQSLVNLNQISEADSLVGDIYQSSGSRASLLKWAELAALGGSADLALERYQAAFNLTPDAAVWLKMLDLSAQNDYLRFAELWELGAAYQSGNSQAQLHRLNFFYAKTDHRSALTQADAILETETNPWFRAQAENILGRVHFDREEYSSALRSFRKVRLIHKDFPDILVTANYYYILSLIRSGALEEAKLAFAEAKSTLTPDQISELSELLGVQP